MPLLIESKGFMGHGARRSTAGESISVLYSRKAVIIFACPDTSGRGCLPGVSSMICSTSSAEVHVPRQMP